MPVNDALTKKVFELDRASRTDLVLNIEDNDEKTDWVEEAQYRFEAWKKGEVRTFSEEESIIYIIAIAHQKRHPDYWKSRFLIKTRDT